MDGVRCDFPCDRLAERTAASCRFPRQADVQQFASNQDSRIKAIYPFAGERAGLLIVDVKSGDELQDLLGSLPFAGITKTEIHPTGTVQSALKTMEAAERRIASMSPVGAR